MDEVYRLIHTENFRLEDWNSIELPHLTACLNLYDFLLESDFLVKCFPDEGYGDGQGML